MTQENGKTKEIVDLDEVTVRFAGDSGDGMQLTGSQFSYTTAIVGNDLSTLPDYPAEIRAPAGTLYGVSGFQLHFSSSYINFNIIFLIIGKIIKTVFKLVLELIYDGSLNHVFSILLILFLFRSITLFYDVRGVR